MFQAAITHAKNNATSLSSAKEILENSLEVFCQACDIVAEEFELSEACTVALGDYKRCERERQDYLRKSDILEADEKREEGIGHLGKLTHYYASKIFLIAYFCFIHFSH